MHTTTSRQAKRTPKAAQPALPYPDLEKNEGKLFWLAAYFNDLNHARTLQQVFTEMCRRNRSEMVLMAMSAGTGRLTEEARQSFSQVVKNGLLPFAHEGTTVFDAPGAMQ